MLGLPSMSACSKDREDSTPGKTENEAATTAESAKMGGHTFSSNLRLYVFIVRETGGEREWIGETRSPRPLDIPRCASWGVCVSGRADMKALARQIAAKKIPYLRIEYWAVDGDLAHLEGLRELRGLGLFATQITDAGLAHLKGLTEMLETCAKTIFVARFADIKHVIAPEKIDAYCAERPATIYRDDRLSGMLD